MIILLTATQKSGEFTRCAQDVDSLSNQRQRVKATWIENRNETACK